MQIRDAQPADLPVIAPIFREIVADGETYAYPEDLTDAQIAAAWMEPPPARCIVAYAADGTSPDNTPDEAKVAELVASGVVTNPVARTLAMLVNEAVDLVDRGEAGPADVDLAMTLGTGYPKGTIAWGREIGFRTVRDQLIELDKAFPGGRYRPSPALDTIE